MPNRETLLALAAKIEALAIAEARLVASYAPGLNGKGIQAASHAFNVAAALRAVAEGED